MVALFLLVISVVPLAYGCIGIHIATTIFQEIDGAIYILIGSILFTGGMISSSIGWHRRKMTRLATDLQGRVDRLARSLERWPGVSDK